MTFGAEQRGIVVWSLVAISVTVIVVGGAYAWLPPKLVGADASMALAERIGFVLKWNLLVFLWLAGCVHAVASGRFKWPSDRKGSAYGRPSPALAVRAAILQNSLEQTVLTVGANVVLATVLQGSELVVIPALVILYLVGRIAFAARYAKGAVARAFGMSLTGATIIAGYGIAAGLIIAGR